MSTHRYPRALRDRDGWASYLEARRTAEPHLHQIEPTNCCPYSCVMCPRGRHMTRRLGFMSMSLYRKVIDEVAGYGEPVRSKVIELFHFGESLLHPQIDEMIGYASERGLRTALSVNAPQLTPAMARQILARNPHQLIVSLDGHNADTYRALRGTNADYVAAVRNLEAIPALLADIGGTTRVCVRMIRMHANASQEEAFVRDWRARGLDVEIRPFFPWTEVELVSLGKVEKYPPGMPCPFPWEYLVVQWDGTVVPCCRDYNGVNALGNVREKTLEEIWNGDEYGEFRDRHRFGDYGDNKFCRDCMDIFYTESKAGEALGVNAGLAPSAAHTLDRLWNSAVSSHAERPLMVDALDGSCYSYADVDEVVGRTASRLRKAGVRQHDRLVICSPPHVEAAVLFWAAMRLGVTFVPLDPRLPHTTLEEILTEVAPRMFFCDREINRLFAAGTGGQRVVLDDLDDRPIAGAERFADWLGDEAGESIGCSVESKDPAIVLFTSGTSGRPKGVVLSHGAVFRSGALVARSYCWQEEDLLWSLGDFHTMSGFRNPLVATLHVGASFLLTPSPSRANALLVAAELQRFNVTILSTVPALLRQFVKVAGRLEGSPFSTVRQVLSTGSILTPEIEAEFRHRFQVPIYNYYGLTETAGLCLGMLPGYEAESGSIGWPVGCEIMISSADLLPVPDGTPGDLLLRSHNLMTGYFHSLENGPQLRSGWFATGDMACRNADGSITLLGRRGEAIKDIRGELLHPAEIERVLEQHPLIAEAGVCRIDGPDGEERFATFLVLEGAFTEGAVLMNDLRLDLFDKLGPTRLPAYIQVVSGLPRGNTGKLLRNKLAELLTLGEKHA